MPGRPRTNALGELVLDPRSGEPTIDVDFTNANRALATSSKISGLQVRRVAGGLSVFLHSVLAALPVRLEIPLVRM